MAYEKVWEKRESGKIKDALHKLSKAIINKCRGYTIVFEDLKGMRKSTNKKGKRYNKFKGKVQRCSINSKRFKRLWNAMPTRRLQFYVEYKDLLNGSTTSYVDRRKRLKSARYVAQS
ncbi:MAG: IS200/IS605 family accessory protein TnpB-related protein [Candidatus Jordarchaeales archaeon]|nr:IS200/IS605 family accessory protein TnpB-related protein [Candidatus Jordarchaeia archaeon]